MKFVAALIAATHAQACTDDDFGDVCEEDAYCGYFQPAEGDATRACSTEDQSASAEISADVFTCDAPAAAEEAASTLSA